MKIDKQNISKPLFTNVGNKSPEKITIYIYTLGELIKFINEFCELPSTFNIGQIYNMSYYDILNYNGYKYALFFDDYHLEIYTKRDSLKYEENYKCGINK